MVPILNVSIGSLVWVIRNPLQKLTIFPKICKEIPWPNDGSVLHHFQFVPVAGGHKQRNFHGWWLDKAYHLTPPQGMQGPYVFYSVENLHHKISWNYWYSVGGTRSDVLDNQLASLLKERSAWPPLNHRVISVANGQGIPSSTNLAASLQPSVAEVAWE